ncbi:dihydrodipicolinate synthase [Aureobasidium pullulans]|nr:dihydrodipicolinate synthase [Aureobasidium pullulans]
MHPNDSSSKVPAPGVWVPAVTFFEPGTDELDLESQKAYYNYLSQTGLAGLVVLGTNAETFLLTRTERTSLLKCARDAVGPQYPIMAGVGGHSTKQVLEYIADAADAGADYALVLPPGYFGPATTEVVVRRFYAQIAEASTLPIVLYNFPGVCNGVDLSSSLISELATAHENIVGVKLTCGSVGKITRLAAQLPASRFSVYGGQSDFLIGGLSVGSAGCIAAFANVFPKTLSQIYKLWTEGHHEEALKLHRVASLAEEPCKAGIASTKYATSVFSAPKAGIKDAEAKLRPRQPYPPAGEAVQTKIRDTMAEMSKLEG